jgi:hypothetical protein
MVDAVVLPTKPVFLQNPSFGQTVEITGSRSPENQAKSAIVRLSRKTRYTPFEAP